ncbi:MAG TPA: glycerol-3-phosphate dehydrogenase subunit GlpB [Gaiellaceae bacterium]|nr:glycerol-3-phosphate dehydrogenase subunit GlpB [Gaiellaceae bacterium]
MTYDTVVIGAGLAGLTAALRLADEGERVLVVAKGVGSMHLAPATIDVLGFDRGRVESPAQALPAFAAANPDHPYARLSRGLVAASLDWLKARLPALGYRGGLEENLLLPTAVGAPKPSALVPETMAAGDLRAGGRFVFVGLGLKDFYPGYLADNLAEARLDGQVISARALEASPPVAGEADRTSAGFARLFEQPAIRDAVVRELVGTLERDERVGFPAVLGLARAREVWRELEARLARPVFEVATLPPSLSGIRLYEAMSAALRQAGGRIHVGEPVVGAETRGGRVEAVVTQPAGRATTHRARSFVLATGGFASGGLEVDSYGKVSEGVFDLPLAAAPAPGAARFLPDYFDEHPLNRVGVGVDERLRPVDADGRLQYENLHASGATLAGALPWQEASGNGLSLATGYAAAAAILERAS